MKGEEHSATAKLASVGKQIIACMAIGLAIYICLEAVVQFSFGLEVADRFFTPLTMTLLAVAVYPFVRRFMDASK